jgi:hypothetical protein
VEAAAVKLGLGERRDRRERRRHPKNGNRRNTVFLIEFRMGKSCR